MPSANEKSVRHAEIAARAAALFATNGVQATTMENVAAAVGIQKASLYYFFGSKDALVGAIIRPAVQAMCDKIDSIAATDNSPDVQLRMAIGALAQAFDVYADEMVILVRERLHVIVTDDEYQEIRRLKAHFTTIWDHIIAAGQRAGLFTAGDSRLQAFAMIGALNWMYAWYEPNTYDVDTVTTMFIEVLVEGILTRPTPTN